MTTPMPAVRLARPFLIAAFLSFASVLPLAGQQSANPTDPDQQCWVDPFCAFSDEHGTSSQRLYNTLCIAYGGDPATFQDFVASGWLPPERAKN